MCLEIDISTTPTMLTLFMISETVVTLLSRMATAWSIDEVVLISDRRVETEKLVDAVVMLRWASRVVPVLRQVRASCLVEVVLRQTADMDVAFGDSWDVHADYGTIITLLVPSDLSEFLDLSILIIEHLVFETAIDRLIVSLVRLKSLRVAAGLSMMMGCDVLQLVRSKNWLDVMAWVWMLSYDAAAVRMSVA